MYLLCRIIQQMLTVTRMHDSCRLNPLTPTIATSVQLKASCSRLG